MMQKKGVPLSKNKPPAKPSNAGKPAENKKQEPQKNQFKSTGVIKSIVKQMLTSKKVEDKPEVALEPKEVEIITIIDSVVVEEQIEKVVLAEAKVEEAKVEEAKAEEAKAEEVLEKQPTISEKFINMFFSSKKNEPIENDEAPKENVRDDIEEDVPVKEDMDRDEVVPFVQPQVEESVVEEPVVEKPVVEKPVVEEPVVEEPVVEEPVVEKPVVEEPVVEEPVVNESLEELKEKVDLPSLEKPVTTEIDIKLKTSYFFCCTM